MDKPLAHLGARITTLRTPALMVARVIDRYVRLTGGVREYTSVKIPHLVHLVDRATMRRGGEGWIVEFRTPGGAIAFTFKGFDHDELDTLADRLVLAVARWRARNATRARCAAATAIALAATHATRGLALGVLMDATRELGAEDYDRAFGGAVHALALAVGYEHPAYLAARSAWS